MISERMQMLLPQIKEYMTGQPVMKAWLFGSYSRGEESEDSDLDIMVDFDESDGVVSLFKMGAMLMDLSDILGVRVDLVDRKGLLHFAKESVERDKILLYERTT